MTLKKEIEAWLKQQKPQSVGVKLYARCEGHNTRLLQRFQKSTNADSYTKQKLPYELKRLLKNIKEIETIPPALPIILNTAVKDAPIAPDARPSEPIPFEIEELRQKRNRLYNQRRHIHSQLLLYATDEDRYQAASKIMQLTEEIEASWKIHDAWKKTGVVPRTTVEDNRLMVEKVIRMMNLRTYVSREQAKLKKTLPPDKEMKVRAKLKTFQEELQQIEKELNI